MIENRLPGEPVTAAYRLAGAVYPLNAPFHPAEAYPEYRGGELGPKNLVYAGVRELLRLLGLDEARFGTQAWNPLGDLVRPGDRVIVKPNFLWHSHKHRPDEWEQVITHGSVVRAVVDYVLIALAGHGEVWIADGPQLDADWGKIVSRTGVGSVCEFYRSLSAVPIQLLDLRDTWVDQRGDVAYARVPLPGDPAGSTVVDLGEHSRLVGHPGTGHFYGADYDQADTNDHHSAGRHEYRLAKTATVADVFINLPKMKTHKKVGVTLSLKNLVGINAGRNWLPHHTDGDPSTGGDQFPCRSVRSSSERLGIRGLQRLALRYPTIVAPIFRAAKVVATPIWGHTEEVVRNGNWFGNDTAWRMVHDINRALLYSNSDGLSFPRSRPKRYLAIVDGVIAGDGNGPAAPDRFEAGLLIAGFNPVAVDCTATRLMGFDPWRVPMLREAFSPSDLPLANFDYAELRVRSNRPEWNGPLADLRDEDCYHFRPHFGWRGEIELRPPFRLASAKP